MLFFVGAVLDLVDLVQFLPDVGGLEILHHRFQQMGGTAGILSAGREGIKIVGILNFRHDRFSLLFVLR